MHAKSTTGHSQRFSLIIATRSPRFTPQLSSAATTPRTRPYIVRAIIGFHPSVLFHIAAVSPSRCAMPARMSLIVRNSSMCVSFRFSRSGTAYL